VAHTEDVTRAARDMEMVKSFSFQVIAETRRELLERALAHEEAATELASLRERVAALEKAAAKWESIASALTRLANQDIRPGSGRNNGDKKGHEDE
jgi:hypothetical protein